MNIENKKKYRAKAKDSFKTKKNLFLFSLSILGKNDFTDISFKEFEITDDLVKLYSTEYWQEPEDYKINDHPIKEIYNSITKLEKSNVNQIKHLESEYIESFQTIFSESDFDKLLNQKMCHYCQISITEIITLSEKRLLYKKNFRGWSLEIDRLNSNYEYTPNNCVMACYWCNNAKTDEFMESEFKEVGNVINNIWKNRFK